MDDPDIDRAWEYLNDYRRVFGERSYGLEIIRLLPAEQLLVSDSLYRAAEQLLAIDKPKLARPYVAALSKLDADSGEYWMLAGNMWLNMGDTSQAERAFSQALLKFKAPQEAWKALARISARESDLEQTLVWLNKLRSKMDDEELIEFLMDPAFEKLPQVLQHLD